MDGARRVSSRRKFFAGVAVGAGATALPHWLAHAFGLKVLHLLPGDFDRPQCLIADSRRDTLLVLVIPREPDERWHRGYVLGALLNYGTDEQLAPLSAVDVRCAFASELTDLGAERVEGEPWAVLVDKASGRSRAIDLPLPSLEEIAKELGVDQPEEDVASAGVWGDPEIRASVRQIDILAAAIVGAIEEELPALAKAEQARLDPADREHLDRSLRDGIPLPHALLERCAAQLLVAARSSASDLPPEYVRNLLAQAVRVRLVARAIPGSRWARGGGCGVQIEGEEPSMAACGMGHVPRLSRRFLHFFSEQ